MALIHHASLPLDLVCYSGQRLCWLFSRWCYSHLSDLLSGGLLSVVVWKPFHHICMTHSSWYWAFSRPLLTFRFLEVSTPSLLYLFLHATAGSYLTPNWAFHKVCVFQQLFLLISNSLLKLVIPLCDWCWGAITLKFLEPIWQLNLEFTLSISNLQPFPIKLWPLAWLSFGSSETCGEENTKDTMVWVQFHGVIGPTIPRGINPLIVDENMVKLMGGSSLMHPGPETVSRSRESCLCWVKLIFLA